MTPQERARRAAEAMWSSDQASRWLGMRLVSVDVGTATLTLEVAAHHCNGHGICHGGITFALADSAFAFACNSRNQATVAQHNAITYIAPAQLGDTLTATARELSLTGRSGIYDIRVADQDDRTVAEMRGLSRAIKGRLFEE
ncbi:phenylacetic acid degradation protein PaaI (plasmid) [Dinoroseobacter shibae DFL 12 = DSM 16493]|uniref:Phenylacetic acid degradation protein PaaI n=1 Tax=Dinoroseobacter shibae (strain DSM 16493 / NCIMB 14021 / DFL 12) TaxID=398580 RepID=A8LTI8_DINSH|nr:MULTISPECIES: hydroxyphenylacetyl-CoA thioesterase PaaI [Dinoroseobacter]ABV95555.1 phenylacetic acid degradation protein PaaI [Dinoroseobacter shibae DFL 12 = DSM 16493]MDD9718773.1 hydroxyphenylacetyl-CoA thioesterase PaaI [Dinoroseobacter sp. PD6]URF48895.1 hydroxyphenylacetyl-CoA thioesterase PaaI [Dinoroseobacter shibae]URF53207.1 hydroxyphenylacetyl-CoA thioesterase PaaI [Dinoroseobacter shibae]